LMDEQFDMNPLPNTRPLAKVFFATESAEK